VIDLSRYLFEALRKDEEFILYRGQSQGDPRQAAFASRLRQATARPDSSEIQSAEGGRDDLSDEALAESEASCSRVLVLSPLTEHPRPESLKRLEHECSLREALSPAWAARPIAIARYWNRTVLVLEDPGGMPLDQLVGQPLELTSWLHLAIGLTTTIDQLHRRSIIHKDIKPANVVVNSETGQCWLTGFGIASRLPRERQSPEPPETIAGTLAYMAPEQTGRMNRSIDFRSDLYALGVTLYQLLTGALPFTASDPMEWVHRHIAGKPVPPSERLKNAPTPLSAIIMKLLAKTAEERYQTAGAVERDLRHCLAEWDAQGCIDDFLLGQRDTPDRLVIPEKLYGRAHEVETLLAVFDRIVKSGTPELVLVSGYSGIGKSSVVNELHKALVPPRGLFAAGKFDQYKRDIPYSTLAQAFQNLVRPLLGKSETELSGWRDALVEAVGPNGRLMIDIVPELKIIIGEQPPVLELPPQDAQWRFRLIFRRFIDVFANPEHPLALFLDDLQWLDAATLDLLEDLLTHPDVNHLMLIGAYRDNEVTVTHPLMQKLAAIKTAGGKVAEITLGPLGREHLGQLVADALRCESELARPLSQLVHEKTGGNPFFAIQFVSSLAEERMLIFDHDTTRWCWDLDRIHAKGYTDNVVDLMVGKLARLPAETQKALQQLACLGNIADTTMLSIVLGVQEEQVHTALWPSVRQELVDRLAGAYRFVHDRVQEAAYSLIAEGLRGAAHLRIGRLLAERTPREKREEAIFDIVSQLNRGAALIDSRDEREQLAELNLIAGKRAKSSTAYASALEYFSAGSAHLTDDRWERRHELSFALELYRAECEFLTGKLAAAGEHLKRLSSRAASTVERASVACLLLDLYTTLDQSDHAVAVCIDYLGHLGVEWSPHPAEDELRREYERTWSLLGRREIEELIDLPLMSDPESVATLDVLNKTLAPALFTDANLFSLLLWRMVNLSLEHGNTDASCFVYTQLVASAGPRFGNYKAGFRFGRLGYDLVERHGLRRFQGRTYLGFAVFTISWTEHLRMARDFIRRAFDVANTIGDLTFAAFSWHNLIGNLLATGDPLVDVQREAERGLEFAQNARFGLEIDIITAQLSLVRTLRGLTATFGCFNGALFDEVQFEGRLANVPALAFAACWYWTRKLQARFFAGDYASAVDASLNAQRLLWTSPSHLELAEAHFYGALSHAASCDAGFPVQYQQHFEALTAHHKQLEIWAENCPENFENRAALVGAEIARIEGRDSDAMRLYEQAIRSANTNGFVHNEALVNELAARFYRARGFEKIANAYLRDARYGYLRWGADGKVRQLDELYPRLREEEPVLAPTSTIGAPLEHLDFGTVIKVSQAISGEIVLEKLVETLMRIAIEHAGAERGVLVLPAGSEQRIEAEATTSGDTIVVLLKEAANPTALPESIVHYVLRTQQTVILDDASSQNSFSEDNYIRGHHARSILCMPLINQAKLIGVLYLENNLAPHVFTPARITVLRLLASQAAISLENTRLYRDLELREAKIRRLVDANIMGIVIFDLEGGIIEANEAFLRMLGYSRADLLSGRVRWTELTPAEWRQPDERALAEIATTGIFQPFEKEYFHHDGSRVPVMIGGAVFEGVGHEGVAFVLDLSEQKRAEEALRRSERYLSEAQRLSQTGSFGWDVTTGKIYWTQETFRIFEHDLRTEPTLELVLHRTHPADRSMVRELIDRVSHERKNFDFEHRLLMPDGSIKYLRVVGHPWVKDESGRFEFIGAVTDITERKLAEKALQEKEVRLRETQTELAHVGRVTTMGELAASIAHEVKQPLVGVITNASASLRFLTGDSPNLVETREAMHAIIRDGNRAADVVSRMRNLFKKAPPKKELLNINEAVEEVVILMRGEARRKRAALRTELAANLPSVMADRVQIQQVVMNLILNGLEAMNEVEDRERDLVIRTQRSEGDRVRVAVQDSGVGIDPLKVERIFDAFHTTKPGGMGMGLSISRSIVESHGGRLWATANDGPGATFQFTL